MAGLEISVVIPAYNEEEAVGHTVSSLSETLKRSAAKFEIIVVDDGSSDKTHDAARRAGADTIRHPVNRGYGRALLSGFAKAKYEWILMIDGDGSYPAEELELLLPHAPACDLVIGARQGKHFWGSPLKAILRLIYLRLARFVTGEKVPDANSGLRLLRKSAFDTSMPFLCLGYSFTTTMTLSFLQSGRFVAYVPVRYAKRKGYSKVKPIRDILRTLQIMTGMMLYYNPLKLTVALSAAALAASAAVFVAIAALGWISAAFFAATVTAALSVLIFLIGCLLDALRMHFNAFRGTHRL